MSVYLINFIVYTTAMIGMIFLAVFVYKKFSYSGKAKSKFLNIEDSINLAPRKNLYVVKAGKERFLIASDAERTSFLAKLESNAKIENKTSVDDLPTIIDFQKKSEEKKVFKNIINNI